MTPQEDELVKNWIRPGAIVPVTPESVRILVNALRAALAQPEQEELGEIVPADEEQLKRIAKLVEQEPVAWRHWLQVDGEQFPQLTLVPRTDKDDPLYTAPQREWQGLTDKEHEQIAIDCGCASADWVFYGAAVERKLREKNT